MLLAETPTPTSFILSNANDTATFTSSEYRFSVDMLSALAFPERENPAVTNINTKVTNANLMDLLQMRL
jgi:hypothetical protein